MKKVEKSEYFSKLGKKGGKAVKKKLGRDHFAEMGKKSGEARRKKLAQQKAK